MNIKNIEYLKSNLFAYIVCSENNTYCICLFQNEIKDSYNFYEIDSIRTEQINIDCLWQSKWVADIDQIDVSIPIEFINIEEMVFDKYIYVCIDNHDFNLYKNTLDWQYIRKYKTTTDNYLNKTQDEQQIKQSVIDGNYFFDDEYSYLFISKRVHKYISMLFEQ